jgi:hypothetical protein
MLSGNANRFRAELAVTRHHAIARTSRRLLLV